MFENNDIIRLKELQRIRLNKIKRYVKAKRGLNIDDQYIDSLFVCFDYNNSSKEVLPPLLESKVLKLKNKGINHDVIFDYEDLQIIIEIASNYKYSFTKNQEVLKDLLQNIDTLFHRANFISKYNINNTQAINAEELTKTRKRATFTTSSKNIDINYINETIDQYVDAWRLYYQQYRNKPVLLEFNHISKDTRYWRVNYNEAAMPHLLGLPNYNDYINTELFQDVLYQLPSHNHNYVINNFLTAINDLRPEIIKHEVNSTHKFNWERLHSKAMFFKNFGLPEANDICIYKLCNKQDSYKILKKCSNLQLNDYVELELITNNKSNTTSLIPKSIRLIKKEQENRPNRLYLGLASNISREYARIVIESLEKNDDTIFNIDNYICLNQEKLYGSAELICETRNIFDSILLKRIDLNYLFLSCDYENDQRKQANNSEKKQIADFYQTIKRGPISVISFKEILNLAKKVKLDYKSNNNLLLEIKQFFYQQNMNIVKEQMISKKKSKHTSI